MKESTKASLTFMLMVVLCSFSIGIEIWHVAVVSGFAALYWMLQMLAVQWLEAIRDALKKQVEEDDSPR